MSGDCLDCCVDVSAGLALPASCASRLRAERFSGDVPGCMPLWAPTPLSALGSGLLELATAVVAVGAAGVLSAACTCVMACAACGRWYTR